MTGARISTLATLRGSIERIEAPADAMALSRVALGHPDADAFLQGGRRVLVELRMRVGRRRARTRTGAARIEVAFRVERHGWCASLRAREEMMLSPSTAVKGLIRLTRRARPQHDFGGAGRR